jgi:predicted amidohydrolase YtcJ
VSDIASAADLVFTNAAVYTVDATDSWAQAVAVRGGRIVAVGTDDDVRTLIGPRTTVHDLDGKMLLPGFQDAHCHPPSAGREILTCDLNPAFRIEGYERIVAEYAGSHPEVEWITGGGWSMDSFPGGTPTKDILDRIVSDRPVYLPNRDGHGAWVNSRALEMAGITAETPDPSDGRIERDAQGEPAGTLHEGAMELVEVLMPPTSIEEWEEGLLVAQRHLHSLGITAWQDAIVGGSYDTLDAYIGLAKRGALTARVVAALWWDRHRGEEQIEELLAQRDRGSVGRLRSTSVKIMQDGVLEDFTAAVIEPYLNRNGVPTDNHGLSFVDPELLKGYATRLDAEGFQVHIHAIGERAVREALDALEAVRRANGANDHRHHIAHIQIVHPDDLPRFRQLDVVANGQPLWASYEGQMDHLTIPFIGPERSAWQYPFASLVRSGARLAFGSDWSVSSPNPLWEMAIAVHRLNPAQAVEVVGKRGVTEPFLPEERIDLATAIRAFTMGSAYVNHLDHVTGSVEVGKLADLAVVDGNLFELSLDEFFRAKVLLTLVEGEVVFADPSFA